MQPSITPTEPVTAVFSQPSTAVDREPTQETLEELHAKVEDIKDLCVSIHQTIITDYQSRTARESQLQRRVHILCATFFLAAITLAAILILAPGTISAVAVLGLTIGPELSLFPPAIACACYGYFSLQPELTVIEKEKEILAERWFTYGDLSRRLENPEQLKVLIENHRQRAAAEWEMDYVRAIRDDSHYNLEEFNRTIQRYQKAKESKNFTQMDGLKHLYMTLQRTDRWGRVGQVAERFDLEVGNVSEGDRFQFTKAADGKTRGPYRYQSQDGRIETGCYI